MRTRGASRYLHLVRKCIDMAEQANHPNNRETLVRFAAIWLSLAADELTEASCHHSDGPLPLYPPKADMCGALANVCYGPEADMPNVRVIISLFKPIPINAD
jgi:hypothetical protein